MTNSTPLILAKKKQAYSFFQNNQLSEAKTLLAELCKTDRRDADVWNLLAAVHGRLQEYVEAERCARRVVELQPKSNGAYNNLANALKFQGKFQVPTPNPASKPRRTQCCTDADSPRL